VPRSSARAHSSDQLPLPRPAQGDGDDKRSDLPSRFPFVPQFTLIGRTATILRNNCEIKYRSVAPVRPVDRL
jgi:hypothetical protein